MTSIVIYSNKNMFQVNV